MSFYHMFSKMCISYIHFESVRHLKDWIHGPNKLLCDRSITVFLDTTNTSVTKKQNQNYSPFDTQIQNFGDWLMDHISLAPLD